MTSRRKLTLATAGAVAALALGGAAVVQATGDDGDTQAQGRRPTRRRPLR
ncbi:MAG: hypothetical protein QOE31_3844 [Solirubrobacteraceae bacterium]|nr:hypothetical protein [Solirubrobacteraceae bacterium]